MNMAGKRLFDQAVSHIWYGGSRRMEQSYEYQESSYVGFVELSPKHIPRPEDLIEWLRDVRGVERVEWHNTKASQGNVGDHYSERNFLVYASLGGPGSASTRMEFELTRYKHMKNDQVPHTVTVCFKQPIVDLVPEAWRILAAITDGKEVFPELAAAYREKSLKKWQAVLAPASGSQAAASIATAAPFKKSRSDTPGEASASAAAGAGRDGDEAAAQAGFSARVEASPAGCHGLGDAKYHDQLLAAWEFLQSAIKCVTRLDDLLLRPGSDPLRALLERPRDEQLLEIATAQRCRDRSAMHSRLARGETI